MFEWLRSYYVEWCHFFFPQKGPAQKSEQDHVFSFSYQEVPPHTTYHFTNLAALSSHGGAISQIKIRFVHSYGRVIEIDTAKRTEMHHLTWEGGKATPKTLFAGLTPSGNPELFDKGHDELKQILEHPTSYERSLVARNTVRYGVKFWHAAYKFPCLYLGDFSILEELGNGYYQWLSAPLSFVIPPAMCLTEKCTVRAYKDSLSSPNLALSDIPYLLHHTQKHFPLRDMFVAPVNPELYNAVVRCLDKDCTRYSEPISIKEALQWLADEIQASQESLHPHTEL